MDKARMVVQHPDVAGNRKESPVKRMLVGLLCGICGYIVTVEASYFLILLISSNRRDLSLVAAINSALVFGPGGAVAAFAVGVMWVVRRRRIAALH